MALEVQKYFMKKMFQIEHTETVRPSLKVGIGPGRHGILGPLGLYCRSTGKHFHSILLDMFILTLLELRSEQKIPGKH